MYTHGHAHADEKHYTQRDAGNKKRGKEKEENGGERGEARCTGEEQRPGGGVEEQDGCCENPPRTGVPTLPATTPLAYAGRLSFFVYCKIRAILPHC